MSDPRIAFHLINIEIDFIIDIVRAWCEAHPEERCIFTVRSAPEAQMIVNRFPFLANKGDFVLRDGLNHRDYPTVKFWLTTEQGGPPVNGIPSYSCFHGQPAKGQTLLTTTDKGYAGYLLLGPLQRQGIEHHYTYHYGKLPKMPVLINAGYARTDALLQGAWQRQEVLHDLGLDPALKTVLYAPAFNEGGSLRECGKDIVATLMSLHDCNVIIKLAVDNFERFTDFRMNGGINWFEELSGFERCNRVRIARDTNIFPMIAASDVMVTDVSSVGLDFMLTGKPVVFMDSPRFYSHYLQMAFPHEDTQKWTSVQWINGGRDFGIVALTLEELPEKVREALAIGQSQTFATEMQQRLLYNAGKATPFIVKTIDRLLEKHAAESAALYTKVQFAGGRNVGNSFTSAKQVEHDAAAAGMGINEYLEFSEDTPKKRGHRDRIVEGMRGYGLLAPDKRCMLEIGAGTGRFTEKILEAAPQRYEIYETASDWLESLHKRFVRPDSPVVLQPTDGVSLRATPTGSCDLVHAHAVFVYLHFTTFVRYLMEVSRVCKIGGYACFDVLYDTDWSLFTARSWITNNYCFPTVLSRSLSESMYRELGFSICGEFTEMYAASYSRYIVLKKEHAYK